MARPIVGTRGQGGRDPNRGRHPLAPQYADPGYYPEADPYQEAGEAQYADYGDAGYEDAAEYPAPASAENRWYSGVAADHPKLQAQRTRVDTWMEVEFRFAGSRIKRRTLACVIIGIFALTPLFLISRPIIQLDRATLSAVEPDIGGTGAFLNLMACLAITPLVTLTRCHWFVPLRRWFGVVMAATALEDAITQGFVGTFIGGFVGNLTGHTFLLVGLCMVIIATCVAIISNNAMMRALGRYWKPLQRLTYVIWLLLGVHLALLEGIGFQNGTNGPSASADGAPIVHQRFYQWAALSLPLFLLRLPPVKRWVVERQANGETWRVWMVFGPLAILYVLAYGYIINELMFKGISAFREQPVNG